MTLKAFMGIITLKKSFKIKHLDYVHLLIYVNWFQKIIKKTLYVYICDDNIKFDELNKCFPFKNGLYDFINNTFREYKPDDYITFTVDYDYRESTENELIDIEENNKTIENNITEQIMFTNNDVWLWYKN